MFPVAVLVPIILAVAAGCYAWWAVAEPPPKFDDELSLADSSPPMNLFAASPGASSEGVVLLI